jgi:hypothetical protein
MSRPYYETGIDMSGQAGGRGYLMQAVITVLDAVTDDPAWTALALEPNLASEKIDVVWYYPNRKKVVQIKSSQNQITVRDVRIWANDLKASLPCAEHELRLIGPVSAGVAKLRAHDSVLIPTPQSLDLEGLLHQAAHKLDLYLRGRNLPPHPPKVRESIVLTLVAKLAGYATAGAPVVREAFDTILRTWITERQPEADTGQYAGEFQNALVLEDLQSEPHPEGWATLFRLEVRNAHSHKTIENVCIRVVSLVSFDGNDSRERLPFTSPLLAITGTGRMPHSPPETSRSLVASASVFFDFVWVHSHRKAGHSLRYGECVKDQPFPHQGNERWKLTHDDFLDPGKYKVIIEVQGRDVVPVRKQFVFWGDKTGQHCVDAHDPSAQSTEPLEFAPIDLDTLPADMHPHQLRALEAELRKPDYDGMSAEAAYRKIDKDKTMCGLSEVRFVNSAALATIPENQRHRTIVITDEERSGFPGGIPGFPNAIRRSDFDIAWQAVRGS